MAMGLAAGLITIPVTTGVPLTVKEALLLVTPAKVAVMVAVPGAAPVASPLELMLAIVEF